MRTLALTLGAAVALAGPAAAQQKAGGLVISQAQLRASLGANPNTAGYLAIASTSAGADRLLGAACACAASVQLHQTMTHGDHTMMSAISTAVVPAGGKLLLSPGGLHLMVMGLKTPLKDGATQEMTLRFERAGAVKVRFAVRSRVVAPR
jgi:periplasmic copper chaperone A